MDPARLGVDARVGVVHRDSPAEVIAGLLQAVLAQIGEQPVTVTPAETPDGDEVVLTIQLNGALFNGTRPGERLAQSRVSLSPREREVVRLVANGLPNKAIAAILDISTWTVATHIRRLFAKLGVNSRAEMVARVLSSGLLNGAEHHHAAEPP